MRRSIGILFTVVLAVGLLSQITPPATLAATPNVGYKGDWFGEDIGDDPTADKPQSKLWYNDGSWWAIMFNQPAANWQIYKLTWPSAWNPTGLVVDTRAKSRADVLWDGSKLFIAAAVRFSSSNQALLSRYSYDAGSDTYSLDAPAVAIMTGSTETLAIDKDTTGRLWIAYTQNKKVYVNASDATGMIWGTPFQLPGSGTLGVDDIASVVAYKDQAGPSVGVLWSSHGAASAASSMNFARHTDSDAPGIWQAVEQIYGGVGSCLADDHFNLKSLQADPSTGALFAAVKTSAGDSGCPSSFTDAILLVVRNPNNTWKWTTFGTTTDNHTRPLVLLDSDNRMVYMFATAPTSCGTIYMKSTSMADPSFASGLGTPFVSANGACMNNATSTKQPVTTSSGLVVLVSDETDKYYYHNVLALGSPPADTMPPTVSSVAPANGVADVGIATSITASFSEPLNASTLTGSSFTLNGPSGAVAASVTYNNGTNTATLNPSADLSFSTTYTAQLTGAITDLAGNALAPMSWSFTTAAAPDTTPPTVTTSSPAVGASAVAAAANVTATFSEALDPATVSATSVRLLGPGAVSLSASVSYDAPSQTITLNPNADLSFNTIYTVQLAGAITDLAGNALAPISWSFTTAAAPAADTTPPTLISVNPADAATNVSTTTAINATFSEPIDGATLSGANFTLTNASGAVAATVTYDSVTRTATLQPQAVLTAGTIYTAQLTGVEDVAGNTLVLVHWSFTTAPAPVQLQLKLLIPAILR
ncbi:MAG: Ig-like domain-containing protein [Roseiflexaceae bacterium]